MQWRVVQQFRKTFITEQQLVERKKKDAKTEAFKRFFYKFHMRSNQSRDCDNPNGLFKYDSRVIVQFKLNTSVD